MKSLFSVPILLSLFLVFPSHAQSHEIVLPLTINVNGTLMASDGEPKIIDGRTYLPLRAAAEAIHAEVIWHNRKNQVTIKKGETTLIFTLNQQTFIKNGESLPLNTPLKQDENRLYLPIREFSEAFNIPIQWDSKRRIISLGKEASYQDGVTPLPQNTNLLVEKYAPRVVTHDRLVGTWVSSDPNKWEIKVNFIHPMKNNRYKIIHVESYENYQGKGKMLVIYYGVGQFDNLNQTLTITEDKVPKYVYGMTYKHSSIDNVRVYDVSENILTPIVLENSNSVEMKPLTKVSKSYSKEY